MTLRTADEKRIKKAIKESKALRNEKNAASSRAKIRKPVNNYPRQASSSGNIASRPIKLDNMSVKSA